MANPQKENGYVMISNHIFDALCKIRIKGQARQVLDYIIRKTYGYNKKEDRISLSQFTLGTGLNRSTVVRCLKYLQKMNLISSDKSVTRGGDKSVTSNPNKYKLNKDFDTWEPIEKVAGVVTFLPKGGDILAQKVVTKVSHTKDNIQKTITKDSVLPVSAKKQKEEKQEKNDRVFKIYAYFLEKTGKKFRLNDLRKKMVKKRISEGYTDDEFFKAIDNFVNDDWPGRKDCLDPLYIFGSQKGKPDFMEKWLNATKENKKPQRRKEKAKPDCDVCGGTGRVLHGEYKNAQCFCVT